MRQDAVYGGERLIYRPAKSRQRQTEDVEKSYGVYDELLIDRNNVKWSGYFGYIPTEVFSQPTTSHMPPTYFPIQPITVGGTMAALKKISTVPLKSFF
ncbi:hypothetical protein Y032_0111g260 [Ancylostoma ceylanicum]|uniref:Uncharacterized protein n=1 Tax=Ancylostoma ceylanicum TaxID=53326 RepID=A0A016TEG4_9BILA|nr:hypothetical protein Y032_0111g260 [Ancylostoma ceylanicum]